MKTNLPTTGQQKLIKTQGSGSGHNVHDILEDSKENLWFATTAEGVYRYDGKYFTNFTTKDGLNSNSILSILEDKNGSIWFGTDSGVARFDARLTDGQARLPDGQGKKFSHFSSTSFLKFSLFPSSRFLVFSMLEDKNGTLWFGTSHGVYCYDARLPDRQRETFTRFLDKIGLINSSGLKLGTVNRMLEDKHGNIWFTTKMEGVCRYDGTSIINYTPKDETYFWGLLEDKNGNIWAGGRNTGVWRYEASLEDGQARLADGQARLPARQGKEFTNVLQNGRFDSYLAYSIIQDKKGNIWFGTEAIYPSKRISEGGVWVYDARLTDGHGKTFKNFSTKDGLSHNGVWSLLEDKDGNIWVGTRNTGLCLYDWKTFTSFSE